MERWMETAWMTVSLLAANSVWTSGSCDVRLREDCHNSLLQMNLELEDANPQRMETAALSADPQLQELASLLQRAKEECPRASEECLPVLTDLRLVVWPYVQAELNWTGDPWMPEAFDSDQAIGRPSHRNGTKTMFFQHVWKAAGLAILANFQQTVQDFTRPSSYGKFCREFQDADPDTRTSFTFVENPIHRFVSGHSEIEFRARSGQEWPLFDDLARKLKDFPVGSAGRARAFFEEFVRSGIWRNGHVKPQVEFLLPVDGCSVPMDFIGRTEHLQRDWQALFAKNNLTDILPFDSGLALHEHTPRDKEAMKRLLGLRSTKPTAGASDVETLEQVGRRVRALCWIYIADFVLFDFEFPSECQQEPLKSAIAMLHKTAQQ